MNAAAWLIQALENTPVVSGIAAEVGEVAFDYALLESASRELGTLAEDEERVGTDFVSGFTSLQIFTG